MDFEKYTLIKEELPSHVKLVAVSKTKPEEDIMALYRAGQRIFGENKAQELKRKYENLPKDIEWHFIGHLQTNKIKYIIPFVSLIHSVDSYKLLKEIDKLAKKSDRVVPCLLQFHIAAEETKYGFDTEECISMLEDPQFVHLENIEVNGVMGMATFTPDMDVVRNEFRNLFEIFTLLKEKYFPEKEYFKECSMGMTDDYRIAVDEGSTMVRIGSAIFGSRNIKTQPEQ